MIQYFCVSAPATATAATAAAAATTTTSTKAANPEICSCRTNPRKLHAKSKYTRQASDRQTSVQIRMDSSNDGLYTHTHTQHTHTHSQHLLTHSLI